MGENILILNGKKIKRNSLVLKPDELNSITGGAGIETSIEQGALIIKGDIDTGIKLAPGAQQLANSYFKENMTNFLYPDATNISINWSAETIEKLISLPGDILFIPTGKDETVTQINARISALKKYKGSIKKPIAFTLHYKTNDFGDLFKEENLFDVLAIHCNVSWGGTPFLHQLKEISENLAKLKKPLFFIGMPRKLQGLSQDDIRYVHPFFAQIGDLFCTHFRGGPSKMKYTDPTDNIVRIKKDLIKKYDTNFKLNRICSCPPCEPHTVSSMFEGVFNAAYKRLKDHEGYTSDEQVNILRKSNESEKDKFMKNRAYKQHLDVFKNMIEIYNTKFRG